MLNRKEIIQTIRMIKDQHLDIRTITLHVSLFDCISDDPDRTALNVARKLADKAGNLKIVFHAHKSKGAIHPREMYITDVRFRPVEGGCRMEIDPGYSPALIAE